MIQRALLDASLRQLGALGAVSPYLGAGIGPDGSAYMKVLAEHQLAVGAALNAYDVDGVTDTTAVGSTTTLVGGRRAPSGQGNLASFVDAERKGRGIVLVGDPFTNETLLVYLTEDFPPPVEPGAEWYALLEPDAGWRATGKPGRIATAIKRATLGFRWGSIIGGVVGLGIIVAVEAKAGR